jgi:serine O-acetyltransferase
MTERFLKAVSGVMASYETHGAINHVDGPDLPSRQDVERIVDDLEFVLFPGYFGGERVTRSNLGYLIGHKLDTIRERLTAEVWKSIRWKCDHSEHCANADNCDFSCADAGPGRACCSEYEDCQGRSVEIVLSLLEAIPELRSTLMLDAEAAFRGDPAARSISEVIVCYPGLHAITIYRVAHFLWERQVPLIPRMMSEYVHGKTGIDIHPGANIGPGLFIDHGNAVVIGETSDIGPNVKIYQGVTLGALSVRKKELAPGERNKRHPTVEEGATIYSGATILGGDTVIGANSVIGGNVWMTRSVPSGMQVLIQEPELVFRERR